MHYEEPTPQESPQAIRDLAREVRLLREQTEKVANAAQAVSDIPQLRREIARVQLFHQWFPTMVITAAIVARLLWLR